MTTSSEEIDEFTVEAREMLDEAEGKLMALDKGGDFKPTYDAVFRVFHSLKGASGFLGLENLQHHMHELESQYQQLQDRGMKASEIGYFLAGIDVSRKLLEGEQVPFDYTVFSTSERETSESAPSNGTPEIKSTKVVVNEQKLEEQQAQSETRATSPRAQPRKKYFGRFLVERGLISERELVLALIEQIKSVPPVPEILLAEELLSSSEIMKIFDHQARYGCEFLTAAVALNFWNDDCSRLVNDFTNKQKVMLGEILIKKGLIKFDVLVDVLDDFINTPDSNDDIEASPVDAVSNLVVSQAARDEEGAFAPGKLQRTLDELLACDGPGYLDLIARVREDLKPIGAKRVGIILLSLHQLISRSVAVGKNDVLERLRLVGEFAFSLTWDVALALEAGKREEDILRQPEHLGTMTHLIQIINEMKQELTP